MAPHTPMEGVTPWPAELAARYRSEGVWADRNLSSYILEAAASHADKTALIDAGDGTRMSFDELARRIDAAAIRLRDLGYRSRDRILIALPNSWQFVVLVIACFRIGVIPVLALANHRRYELSHLAHGSTARAIAVFDQFRDYDYSELIPEVIDDVDSLQESFVAGVPFGGAHSLDELLAPGELSPQDRGWLDDVDIDPDQPVVFQLSGGTSGLPKLIARTHNDYAFNIRKCTEIADLRSDDIHLSALPIAHNFGLACPGVLGALINGTTSVLAPSPSPRKVFDLIEAERVTKAAAVPAVVQKWITYEREHRTGQLATLEVLQVGGSRMPNQLSPAVRAVLGTTLQQVYGMAEGLINMTRLDDPAEVMDETQGRPVSEYDEIKVIDNEGNPLPDGERGLLITRGPYTPRGYFNNPDANEKAFIDGWYCPGDLVVRRPDGNLVVEGREKDVINRGGEKISAELIESLLYQIDDIEQVAAVAMPDPVLGETVCLYVILKDGGELTLDQAIAHLRQVGLASFQYPERLEIVEDIPMTNINKIDKKALRADIAAKLA